MIDQRIIEQFNKSAPFSMDEGKLWALCRIGSHSHGTFIPKNDPNAIDDVDYMGIMMPPETYVFGIRSIHSKPWRTTNFQFEELDCVFYSVQHFLSLLVKSNPNVLGLLWLHPEDYIYVTPEWQEIMSHRKWFSTKSAYPAYKGLIHQHFEKMESGHFSGYMGEKRKQIVEKYGYDVKDAAHMIRLMRMATEFFKTGEMQVRRTSDADFLKMIKTGGYNLNQILQLRGLLEPQMEEAFEDSPLPKEVDFNRVDELTKKLVLKSYNLDYVDFSC